MRLLLALALAMLSGPAVADAADVKAWLCAHAPQLQRCRPGVVEPPAPMPPVEIAPAPLPAPTPAPVESPPAPAPAIEPPPAASPPVAADPPPISKPAPAEKPAPRPTPARPKPHMREIERPVAKPVPAARPAYCGQIAMGIAMLGAEAMKKEARKRGFSSAQIAAAQRACGY